jgi:hypothetical protein
VTNEELKAEVVRLEAELAEARRILNPTCAQETLIGAIRNLQQAHLSEKGNAELFEAKLACQPAPPGWQPIETCPRKAGKEYLLRVKVRAGIRGSSLVGHWMPGGHCIEDHPAIDGGWYFWNGCMFDLAAEPTHWMPLPAVDALPPAPDATAPADDPPSERMLASSLSARRAIEAGVPDAKDAPVPVEMVDTLSGDKSMRVRCPNCEYLVRVAPDAKDASPPQPTSDEVPVEEIESAASLCESEARRWETAAPKTAEHWNRVATILRSHALVAFVRKDAIPPPNAETEA